MQDFFGLEKFTKNQSDLQSSLSRISSQLLQFQSQLVDNKRAVVKITGNSIVDEISIVSFINSIAAKYKFDGITDFKDSYNAKKRSF